ncbi:MAG: M48 family metallopeptidase [Candidatus Omnitrophica bacterium]|nr:M48 family metallopeptidase [Candidatus Omnitrophota bacterium]
MVRARSFYICVIIVTIMGCATVPSTGRQQLALVPTETLLEVSEQNYQQILNQSTICQDQQKIAVVDKVGERVINAARRFMWQHGMEEDLDHFVWGFTLIEDPNTVNAGSLPDGRVIIYTGIFQAAMDENGLAVVLAHEIAHGIAQHGRERMSQLLIAQLGGLSLAEALVRKPVETQQAWLQAYGLGVTYGLLLPYSRAQEKEADTIGLTIMAKAGYDPRGAVAFWQRMMQIPGPQIPPYASTHPTDQDRINAIQKALPEALQAYEQTRFYG